MRFFSLGLVLAAAAGLVACADQVQRDPKTLPIAPSATIKDIMDLYVDPAGDWVFEAFQEIADDKGPRRKQPTDAAGWAEVRRQFVIMSDAADYLVMPGRKAAHPTDKPQFPDVESSPQEIDALLAANHPDFVKRARRLQQAAALGTQAADAKDYAAMMKALVVVDHACEGCHLHFYYPKDQRAKQAAREEGVSFD